jgi:hypothetical protein
MRAATLRLALTEAERSQERACLPAGPDDRERLVMMAKLRILSPAGERQSSIIRPAPSACGRLRAIA